MGKGFMQASSFCIIQANYFLTKPLRKELFSQANFVVYASHLLV